jgi:hypothetical protein
MTTTIMRLSLTLTRGSMWFSNGRGVRGRPENKPGELILGDPVADADCWCPAPGLLDLLFSVKDLRRRIPSTVIDPVAVIVAASRAGAAIEPA